MEKYKLVPMEGTPVFAEHKGLKLTPMEGEPIFSGGAKNTMAYETPLVPPVALDVAHLLPAIPTGIEANMPSTVAQTPKEPIPAFGGTPEPPVAPAPAIPDYINNPNFMPPAIPSRGEEKPKVSPHLINLYNSYISGIYQAGTELGKEMGLGLIPLTRKYVIEEPQKAIKWENKQNTTKSWVGRQFDEFVKGAGGLTYQIPEYVMGGALAKFGLGMTKLAPYVENMADFVVGAIAHGAIKGYEEHPGWKGLYTALKGALEEGVFTRALVGKNPANMTAEEITKRATQAITKTIAKQVSRFTGVGVTRLLYDDVQQGKVPTEQEIADNVTQSLAMALGFSTIPFLERMTDITGDKIGTHRLERELKKSYKTGDIEGVKMAYSNFFQDPGVSDNAKQQLADAMNTADVANKPTQEQPPDLQKELVTQVLNEEADKSPDKVENLLNEVYGPKPETKPTEGRAKQPWEMTREEWDLWRINELNRLNPQLGGRLKGKIAEGGRVKGRAADEMPGPLVGGHYGSTVQRAQNAPSGTWTHEIRHMIDMLLGGHQVSAYIGDMRAHEEAFGRLISTLKRLRKAGRINGRLSNNAEVAQIVLDAFYHERQQLHAVAPDLVDFLEKMGADKYADLNTSHLEIIKQALSEGKPVPDKVLAEYPDLTKTEAIPPKAAPEPPTEATAPQKETVPAEQPPTAEAKPPATPEKPIAKAPAETQPKQTTATPTFSGYQEALDYVDKKAKEYGGRNKYLASEEYKRLYPYLEKLRKQDILPLQGEAKKAMEDAGVKYGDTVEYSAANPFGQVFQYKGIVKKGKDELPYVSLSEHPPGIKKVKWHKGFIKVAEPTPNAQEGVSGAPLGEKGVEQPKTEAKPSEVNLEEEAKKYDSPEEFVKRGIYNLPIENKGLSFNEDLTGAYKGQKNVDLIAKINGKSVGVLQYSEYLGKPHISYIKVADNETGKGIGSDLIKRLQQEYPNEKIEWGMTTSLGTALKKRLDAQLTDIWNKAHPEAKPAEAKIKQPPKTEAKTEKPIPKEETKPLTAEDYIIGESKIKPPKKKVYYTKEIEIKETGEKVKVKMEATKALDKTENDLSFLKVLKDCLG